MSPLVHRANMVRVLRSFVGLAGLWLWAFAAMAQTSVNVALQSNGGVATASSTYNSSYPTTGANNGDRKGASIGNGGVWLDATPNAFPDWLQVTFNNVQSIGEISVFSVQDNYMSPVEPTPTMTFTQYGLVAFQVQYWTGSAWVEVPGGNVTGNNLVWKRLTFAPISTDRIRVLVNSAGGGWSRLAEVEAWSAATFVHLTAPLNNAIATAPATVNLSAKASNATGTIGRVEFYRDATLVATVTTPSSGTTSSGTYTATNTNVAPGNYSYTAKAYDAANPAVVSTSGTAVVSVAQGAGSTNVALQANGGVATASSSYSSAYPPAGANNGDRKGLNVGNGGTWADATSNTYPDWLQVTFNGVKSIGDINVITPQDNYLAPVEPTPTMTFTQYGLIAYQVQYWTGSAWADVPGGNVTGNNLTWRRFLFPAILTDRIRVLVNSAVGNNLSTLAEIEAWTVPPPPRISGSVTAAGAPLAGVGFTASNGGTCTNSDAAGLYSCTVSLGWSGSVTPSLAGYGFTPASRTYSAVQADQTGQDFAAALLAPQISGTVTAGGVPQVGVAFAASNGGTCTTSNGAGQYTCTVTQNWSGSVTPSLAGFLFTPASRDYNNVATNLTGQDFVATVGAGSGTVYYIHPDHLNTPRMIANQTGATVWKWDQQEPFGATPPNDNPSGLGAFEFPLRLPGQYYDKETALHYNVMRDYDPSVGRYVESDPIGLRGGINTYLYVGASPLAFIDPDGLLSCWYSIYSATLTCTNNAGQSFTSSAAASGTLECRDNPQCVDQPFKGPLPPGLYTIRPPGWSLRRPRWLYLDPSSGSNLYGRSGFFIHPWGLSAGCITLHMPDFSTISDWARRDGGGTLGVTD